MDIYERFRLNSQSLYSVLVCGYHESAIKRSAITSQTKPIEVVLKFEDYIDMIVEQIDKKSTGHSLKQEDRVIHRSASKVKIFNDYLKDLVASGRPVDDIISKLNLFLEIQDTEVLNNPTMGEIPITWSEALKQTYQWFLEDVVISQAYLVCNTPEYTKYPPFLIPVLGDAYMSLTLSTEYGLKTESMNSLQSTEVEIPYAKLSGNLQQDSKVRVLLLDKNLNEVKNIVGGFTLMSYASDILKGSKVDWSLYKDNLNPVLVGRNYKAETREYHSKKLEHLDKINKHLLNIVALKYFNRIVSSNQKGVLLVGYNFFRPETYRVGHYGGL